jgi:carboxyl-terminal processing protease
MRSFALLLLLSLGLPVCAVDTDPTLITARHTNATPLVEGPDDTNILKWTARILQHSHYSRQTFNDEVSSRFLDRFLDSLDSQHIYFLQSDLKEFDVFRTRLDDLTLRYGDSSPARLIFNRFRERLSQQFNYVEGLLKTETFNFTSDERFLLNRKSEPRPKDLEEARRLWRDRLRYEYLQEKLGIGRPDVIGDLVLEKLQQKKPKELFKALEDKVSKEKASNVVNVINERLEQKESPGAIAQSIRTKLEKENGEEIIKTISKRYARSLRTLNDFDNDDVIQYYLTALAHVYDPHSDYFGKSELDNFSIGMKLSLFGIGAVLTSEDGFCKIRELKPGPAMRSAKLKPNDKIIAVAQSNQPPVDVVDMKLNKIVEMIRGPKDTEVRLTVIPADATDPSVRKFVTLIREEIKLEDQAAKSKIIEVPVDELNSMRFGVIDLPSFYSAFELEGRNVGAEARSTTTDVARLISKLKQEKVAGIILDLRRNGGGSLEEAIRLTGLFIKEGPVVQVQDSDGRRSVDEDPDSTLFYDGPLVVLTSRFSASASEILSGALQDYGRALIVGDTTTHGKGTVQSLVQLAPILRGNQVTLNSDPGALKITIRKFYRITGSSTQLKGVPPDLVLPSVNNYLEVGESSLENPLKWDTIEAAKYDRLDWVSPYVAELKRRSDRRLAAEKDFAYIADDIARYRKTLEDKTVSLNEAQRLKEKQENDDRAKARRKEIASRPASKYRIFDIGLKEASEPGLPPALGSTNTATNAISIARTPEPDEDLTEEATVEDNKAPHLDPMLEETRRILADFIQLTGKGNLLVRTGPAKVKTQ